MEPASPLLLDVWKEASRHTEIGEAVERIARLLVGHIPADLVLVRTIDLKGAALQTVGVGTRCALGPDLTRDACPPRVLEGLLSWARSGEVLHLDPPAMNERYPGLLPAGLAGDLLAGPLTKDGEPLGLCLFVAYSPGQFEDKHLSAVAALLDPLSVALENDLRLHEVARLREAAEADKRSLLTRLGRQDVADTIVGADSGLKPAMDRVDLVARTDAPVLIFGETGSGKEVIARAVHARSGRAGGPFLRVNCGAIPSELIDSELFGHERGSFTGAIGTRQGWFERADGGTLFLDEIGELPLAAQVRLLRILQDGSFERVGGQRQLKVDVRIIGATHRDLHAMVSEGHFREDLWYRLAVFPIHLPPLRSRPEDIPQLASHFALKASRRFGTPPLLPTTEDVRLLLAYDWPGNARELGTVMERAAILGDGRRLEVGTALGAAALPKPVVIEQPGEPGKDGFPSLNDAMARHIEAALHRAGGQIEGRRGAAALLKINPHTLRARMRKLGIVWANFRE
jgi:hydrogenase-4 transcriptional activator